tara:strand:+ start:207 stop:335 length:129 start_codon:yes stop_codon:yes gene_type:complete
VAPDQRELLAILAMMTASAPATFTVTSTMELKRENVKLKSRP